MGNTITPPSYAAEVRSSPDITVETGVYRSITSLNDLVASGKHTNCWEMFSDNIPKRAENACTGYRENGQGKFIWLSYQTIYNRALCVGSYIMQNELAPVNTFDDPNFSQLRSMGFFCANRPEWFILEQSCNAYNIAIVPLYDTLGVEAVTHVCNQSKLRTLLVSSSCFDAALEAKRSGCTTLTTLMCCDPITEEQQQAAETAGLELLKFQSLFEHKDIKEPCPGTLGDINTICYTSGTTGLPKGVVITHHNVLSTVEATAGAKGGPLGAGGAFELTQTDIHVTYLPLAHVFERLVCQVVLYRGGSLGCFSGNILNLMDDVKELRPTVFISVPRLFNRINDRIAATAASKGVLAQTIFSFALNSKINKFKNTARTTSSVWDRVAFANTKEVLGDRLRFMISGGAPLDPSVHERLQSIFCVPILQGYGMTETFGPSFLCSNEDTVLGHVGGVYPSVEFKLAATPDIGYHTDSELPTGELLVKGNSISPGYFCNPEENAATFADGWLHTGDICVLLPSNGLKIIDRKKNLFKLAQGEYVSPEKIENTIAHSACVNQSFVHGESHLAYLVAIVVPAEDEAKKYMESIGKTYVTLAAVCEDPGFVEHVLQSITSVSDVLKGFEKVKKIKLVPDEFTVQSNLLTPTSKLKRPVAKKHFQEYIDIMCK